MAKGRRNMSDSIDGNTASQEWKDHAYPLQLITIELQGTRHSSRAGMLALLKVIVARIERGDINGETCDDDFGYRFAITSPLESVFDVPASKS